MNTPSPATEAIGRIVLDSAYEVHSELGPGLLESVYQECLALVLTQKSHLVVREHPIPISFRGRRIEVGFRADLIVDSAVLVELKATETLHPLYSAQTITYLKLSTIQLGFLINFNVISLKDGVRRLVNPDLMAPKSTRDRSGTDRT